MAQSENSGNPFAEPNEFDNPFQDPAVTQHRPSPQYATLDVYNPFENRESPPSYEPSAPLPPPTVQPHQQPSRKLSPTEPKNYGSYNTQASAAAATAELLKRQEELNRKAEELDRRERELRHAALGGSSTRQNNWPPLPSFCPVQPCFFQDISMEIPQEFQKTVSTMYYLWMCSTVALLLNFLACLACFCVTPTISGSSFGLSILWALLFTPCSFVCWYRPMYKAFRSDSSFNFFVFFFIFFVQDVIYVLAAIGIPSSGFRSTPCTAALVPVSRRPSRSLLPVSSPTLQSEQLRPMQLQVLPTMPSGPHNLPHLLTLPQVVHSNLALDDAGFTSLFLISP
ncbi:secretory carrier-associated membrane protein 3 isoform X2 [Monodelphis domestica]|uniref:secretory carrier-associated membrane protein 3 isoform X2 n=1 Tax=Monodelphis domestica TaxID=13616 RepID=UPI0024E23305|nr:secretory carrier-associated membrane protein 3 isoform X2 [Monodelphis domestica]